MIICGWCHAETKPDRCVYCGRDPVIPWVQRGAETPTVDDWRLAANRRRVAQARREIGEDATLERVAEHIGVDERTVRRWVSD